MGQSLSSIVSQSLPPKPTFSVNDIPDLTGKIVIVTGANTGVGKETVKALLSHNATVYLAARNPEKAHAAIQDLREQTGREALFLKLDLADLNSVKDAAAEFKEKESQLHILFNNAGVMTPPIDQITEDGYDLQMGTNVLGHFYFTKLLLPILISTAQTSPEKHVRVLTSSSVVHYLSKELDFNTFKDGPARRRVHPKVLYAQSKFADLVLALELARRYGDQGIVSIAVNPGNLASDLPRHLPKLESWLLSSCLYPVPYGALTQLWGGTSKEGAGFNGKYIVPWARIASPRPDALDQELGRQLWQWLEDQVQKL